MAHSACLCHAQRLTLRLQMALEDPPSHPIKKNIPEPGSTKKKLLESAFDGDDFVGKASTRRCVTSPDVSLGSCKRLWMGLI